MKNFIEKLEKILVENLLYISLSLLFLLFSLFLFKLYQVSKSQKKLQHSYNIKVDLNNLMYNLKDAESAQRSYLLTKDEDYLVIFKSKEVDIDSLILILDKLTVDDTDQSKLIDTIIQKINLRLSHLNDRATDFQNSDDDIFATDSYRVKFRKSKLLMSEINDIINRFEDNENNLYLERSEKFEKEQRRLPYYSIALILYTTLVFIFSHL